MTIDNIFRIKRVWESNKNIVWKKIAKGFGYTIILTIITYLIEGITSADIPQLWIIYSGVIISLLQASRKAWQYYDPVKDK